ncbi:HAD-IIIC family phosphatase [Nocardia tengchongensis]|uniref:HAD-IIIC family phosphatase n=1 Tax=Nocardia tengchongensis TaxID=2055889 RepID=UPI0036A92FD8
MTTTAGKPSNIRTLRTTLGDTPLDPRAVFDAVDALDDAMEAEAAGRIIQRSGRLPELTGWLATKVAILSSSTVDELSGMLTTAALRRRLVPTLHIGEFDDWQLAVRSGHGALHEFAPRVTVAVLDDRAVLGAGWEPTSPSEVIARCAAFADEIEDWTTAFHRSPGGLLVLATIPLGPAHRHRWLAYDDRARIESAWLRMNARIAELGASDTPTVVLSGERLAQAAGTTFARNRMRHIASRVYASEYLWALARETANVAAADLGRSAKCLVLDLDDTLWSGVVGDAGPAGVLVGDGYPGSAHRDLQALARDWSAQGVILAIASKNDQEIADKALTEHPGMLLRPDAFATTRIDWNPKPANVSDISTSLNIGIDAVAFVDDNPVERAAMRAGLPEVWTVELPTDPAEYAQTVAGRDDFTVLRLTEEDTRRTPMYRSQAQRTDFERQAESHQDFLRRLGTELTVVHDDPFTRDRLVQLFAKTNQFNLTGRRFGSDEMTRCGREEDMIFAGVRATDRFGDNGIVAALALRRGASSWTLENMVLSCRVFGREIENAILLRLLADTAAAGAEALYGSFVPTARNARCAEVLESVGFAPDPAGEDTVRRHTLANIGQIPAWITFTIKESFRVT